MSRNHGWTIVAICAIILLIVFGVRLSFSVFFVALIDEFGWSRADTSFIFSLTMIVFMVGSPLSGAAVDRFGVRPVFVVGLLILAGGLFLSSRIHTFGQLLITYGTIAGLGIAILGLTQQTAAIAPWFREKRGTAIGLAYAGTGLGALILTPGATWLIDGWGWRTAYVTLGVLVLGLLPLVWWGMRHRVGSREEGAGKRRQEKEIEIEIEIERERDWALGEVLREPRFWLVFAAGLMTMGPVRLLTVHQLAIMREGGIPLERGAYVVGFSGMVTALTFILSGILSDRIGRRATYLAGALCLVAAYGLMVALSRGVGLGGGLIWLYPLFLGLGEGSRSSLVSITASDLFPGRALARVNGLVGGAFAFGAALLPWLGGFWFDQFGNYTGVLLISAGAALFSAGSLWLAGRKNDQ